MSRAERALHKHSEGYNCCQAVACVFAEELGIDEKLLYKAAEGFGGGMGTAKGVCGAVSGAAMVCGLANSDGDIDNAGQTKASTTRMAANIQSAFTEQAGALICRDIKTGNNGGPFTSCADCIRIAVELTEKEIQK
ncbi:MAG: C_GCAxxG_C_C family protein [Clostridiales bacterium]|nr:C_GCAxxG_C_C family protein [Candidatus Crickella caballi]